MRTAAPTNSCHNLQATRALLPTFHPASIAGPLLAAHSKPSSTQSITNKIAVPRSQTTIRVAGTMSATIHLPVNVPEAKDGQVWYFAYGSNMNLKVLRDRRQVAPLASLPAKLDNYVLGFNLYGVPYMEPGMATIHPITPATARAARAIVLPPAAQTVAAAAAASTAQLGKAKGAVSGSANGHASNGHAASNGTNGHVSNGHAAVDEAPAGPTDRQTHINGPPALTSQEAFAMRVAAGLHGVLHLISADGWEVVKATEGVRLKGIGYQVVHVKCTLYDGQQVNALTLQAAPVSVGDNGRILPSKRYLTIIREGAREMGIDPAYCNMLDMHPAYEPPSKTSMTLAKWAMAGTALGLVMPLMPLLAGAAAYKGARRLLGWSTDASNGTTPVASKPDTTPADGVASARHKEQPTPGATVLQTQPHKQPADATDAQSDKQGTAADGTVTPGSSQSTSTTKNDAAVAKPPPMFKIFSAVRGLLDPRLTSFYTWAVFRGLWLAHDIALSPVLGSGKDNNRKVEAARAGKQ